MGPEMGAGGRWFADRIEVTHAIALQFVPLTNRGSFMVTILHVEFTLTDR